MRHHRGGYEGYGAYAVGGMYTVQPGDNLWAIAQRTYGDGAMWRVLAGANADQIFNPNLIFPGETLRLP
jgi:nucleoid-associated protein YgaU